MSLVFHPSGRNLRGIQRQHLCSDPHCTHVYMLILSSFSVTISWNPALKIASLRALSTFTIVSDDSDDSDAVRGIVASCELRGLWLMLYTD